MLKVEKKCLNNQNNRKRDSYITDYFIDLFVDPNLDKEEKDKKLAIILDIFNTQIDSTYKYVITNMFGEYLNQKRKNVEPTHNEQMGIRTIVKSIKRRLNKQNNRKQENFLTEYFIDLFVDPNLDKEEKDEKLAIILDIFNTQNKSKYKYVITNSYGKNLDQKKNNFELATKEYGGVWGIVKSIKKCLNNQNNRKRDSYITEYFIDLFVDPNLDQEEKDKKLAIILDIFNTQIDSKYKYVITNMFGEYLDQKKKTLTLNHNEASARLRIIKRLKKLFNNDLDNNINLDSKEDFTKLDYLIKDILDNNCFNQEKIIVFLIHNNEQINDKVALFKLILTYEPKYMLLLFKYDPYKSYLNSLSELDKDILVMKIMSINNSSFTSEFIANINNVSVEYVNNMILSDSLPEFSILNEKLKKL